MCLFALALFICFYELCFSVPYLLPASHARFRGSKTSKGKKFIKFIAYLSLWGHVNIYRGTLYSLYMSSQSWYSCGFFCLLWLVDVPVLSNFVCAGSFHPKPAQDHKVSICIKIMSMRRSCLCTYCLQEGLMSMKVFSLIIFCSDAYGQDTCNTLPTLSWLCSHMPLYFIFT